MSLRTAVATIGVAASALCVAGCDHPEPYALRAVEPNPALGAPPVQLTFNPEGDWHPEWSPDSSIRYSYRVLERLEGDHCLSFLPPAGGRAYRVMCRRGDHQQDSVDAVTAHAVSTWGRVAVLIETGRPGRLNPDHRSLFLGRTEGRDTLTREFDFPLLTNSGLVHSSAADMVWLDDETLAYLGTAIQYQPSAPGVPADTNDFGIEVVVVLLRGGPPFVRAVPGTQGATSFAVDPADGTAYLTMAGDSVVYTLDLLTGQRQVAVDFGGLGIVRDVRVSGRRLVAVVGGRTRPVAPALFGTAVQYDEGGNLYAVDLPGTAIRTVMNDTLRLFRNVALSPLGDQFAVERFDVRYVRHLDPSGLVILSVDTIVGKASNLWLFRNP